LGFCFKDVDDESMMMMMMILECS